MLPLAGVEAPPVTEDVFFRAGPHLLHGELSYPEVARPQVRSSLRDRTRFWAATCVTTSCSAWAMVLPKVECSPCASITAAWGVARGRPWMWPATLPRSGKPLTLPARWTSGRTCKRPPSSSSRRSRPGVALIGYSFGCALCLTCDRKKTLLPWS